MPSLKNQHFVPRCLLKPFSEGSFGKSINLYNIRGDRLISKAPIKGQCARDYLYGKDGKIEQNLSGIESSFSQSRDRIVAGTDTETDLHDLNFFTYLQSRRTQMAADRLKKAHENLRTDVFEGYDAPPMPSNHMLIMQSLHHCLRTRHYIEDLKIRIMENRAAVDLVISDDPTIFVNRFSAQKLNSATFGVMSSGLMMILPLAPKFAVICYDGQVYTAPDLVNGRMIITKTTDIEAINELQYLKAAENVYFSDWNARDQVRAKFLEVKPNRPTSWSSISHWAFAGHDEHGNERYQKGTSEESRNAGMGLVATSFTYPIPRQWFSVLKHRSKPITFYEGTGAGHVRHPEWLTNG